eukprot:CAMPEP_0172519062 /NCGR_PEP_ID=MMETSP1066-20121228/291187_1 /TAXON_ID=671091 /ORGANISM="Coscinodiscus wailesii, Strain CCMP2513" /LENGTH=1092 /DNA_ID=CAMNT_0013301571 /DNA_START=164 /DNA_END=3438 /DNA_ORIENTATION=-
MPSSLQPGNQSSNQPNASAKGILRKSNITNTVGMQQPNNSPAPSRDAAYTSNNMAYNNMAPACPFCPTCGQAINNPNAAAFILEFLRKTQIIVGGQINPLLATNIQTSNQTLPIENNLSENKMGTLEANSQTPVMHMGLSTPGKVNDPNQGVRTTPNTVDTVAGNVARPQSNAGPAGFNPAELAANMSVNTASGNASWGNAQSNSQTPSLTSKSSAAAFQEMMRSQGMGNVSVGGGSSVVGGGGVGYQGNVARPQSNAGAAGINPLMLVNKSKGNFAPNPQPQPGPTNPAGVQGILRKNTKISQIGKSAPNLMKRSTSIAERKVIERKTSFAAQFALKRQSEDSDSFAQSAELAKLKGNTASGNASWGNAQSNSQTPSLTSKSSAAAFQEMMRSQGMGNVSVGGGSSVVGGGGVGYQGNVARPQSNAGAAGINPLINASWGNAQSNSQTPSLTSKSSAAAFQEMLKNEGLVGKDNKSKLDPLGLRASNVDSNKNVNPSKLETKSGVAGINQVVAASTPSIRPHGNLDMNALPGQSDRLRQFIASASQGNLNQPDRPGAAGINPLLAANMSGTRSQGNLGMNALTGKSESQVMNLTSRQGNNNKSQITGGAGINPLLAANMSGIRSQGNLGMNAPTGQLIPHSKSVTAVGTAGGAGINPLLAASISGMRSHGNLDTKALAGQSPDIKGRNVAANASGGAGINPLLAANMSGVRSQGNIDIKTLTGQSIPHSKSLSGAGINPLLAASLSGMRSHGNLDMRALTGQSSDIKGSNAAGRAAGGAGINPLLAASMSSKLSRGNLDMSAAGGAGINPLLAANMSGVRSQGNLGLGALTGQSTGDKLSHAAGSNVGGAGINPLLAASMSGMRSHGNLGMRAITDQNPGGEGRNAAGSAAGGAGINPLLAANMSGVRSQGNLGLGALTGQSTGDKLSHAAGSNVGGAGINPLLAASMSGMRSHGNLGMRAITDQNPGGEGRNAAGSAAGGAGINPLLAASMSSKLSRGNLDMKALAGASGAGINPLLAASMSGIRSQGNLGLGALTGQSDQATNNASQQGHINKSQVTGGAGINPLLAASMTGIRSQGNLGMKDLMGQSP